MNQELVYQKDNRSVNHECASRFVSGLLYEKYDMITPYDEITGILNDPIFLPLWFAMELNYESNVNVKVHL